MKKYLCLLMALILCLSLWACGSSEPAQSTDATQETVPETTVPETTAPTPENLLRTFAENLDEELISALVDWQNGLQNGASFTVGDGWIYGMGTDNSGRNLAFVKCRTDCTGQDCPG